MRHDPFCFLYHIPEAGYGTSSWYSLHKNKKPNYTTNCRKAHFWSFFCAKIGQLLPEFSFLLLQCKKDFPVPSWDVTNELSLAGNNLIIPGQGEFGKSLTFFYSVVNLFCATVNFCYFHIISLKLDTGTSSCYSLHETKSQIILYNKW